MLQQANELSCSQLSLTIQSTLVPSQHSNLRYAETNPCEAAQKPEYWINFTLFPSQERSCTLGFFSPDCPVLCQLEGTADVVLN